MKSNVIIGCIGDNSNKVSEISRVVTTLLSANEIPAFTIGIENTNEHQKKLLAEVEKGFNQK